MTAENELPGHIQALCMLLAATAAKAAGMPKDIGLKYALKHWSEYREAAEKGWRLIEKHLPVDNSA